MDDDKVIYFRWRTNGNAQKCDGETSADTNKEVPVTWYVTEPSGVLLSSIYNKLRETGKFVHESVVMAECITKEEYEWEMIK